MLLGSCSVVEMSYLLHVGSRSWAWVEAEVPARFQSHSLWPGGVVFPECLSGANKEPEEVSVAAKLPQKATSKSQETEERDDFSKSEDEVSKDFEGSSGISSHNPCRCESLCYKSAAISAPAFCCTPMGQTMGSESEHS